MAKNNNRKHRNAVYNKCNFTCCICGEVFRKPIDWDGVSAISNGYMNFLEIDHIIPVSKGGSDLIENKQALCTKCNLRKSNKIYK